MLCGETYHEGKGATVPEHEWMLWDTKGKYGVDIDCSNIIPETSLRLFHAKKRLTFGDDSVSEGSAYL